MRIAVRLDDIAPVMRWDNFERMMTLLDAYQASPLLGVIPDCKDEKLIKGKDATTKTPEAFCARMRELAENGARIAMHGVRHVYTTEDGGIFPLNRKSEFAGLPLKEQEALLQEGKKRMEEMGLPTEIFMAPSHSYDENTLKALVNSGFKRVTDGFGSAPYRFRGLTFYPIARARESAAQSKHPGTVTVVYHVNGMEDADFAAAKKLLDGAETIAWRALLYEPTVRRSDFGQQIERLTAGGKRLLVERRTRRRGR